MQEHRMIALRRKSNIRNRIYQERWAYILFIPVIAFFFVFHYMPMYGIQLAFKDFMVRKGIAGSPWVGMKHFRALFGSQIFIRALRNTVFISLYKLIFGFPSSVLFALLINELRVKWFKNTVQTLSYLPHFLSWVILGGILRDILSINGVVNYIAGLFGTAPVQFLTEPRSFRSILVLSGIWKEVGWSSIVYLATITGINAELYESAEIDGASHIKQMIYITLPLLAPVISIQLIMSLGGIMSAGFDQVFNLYNNLVYVTGDIIDTYVYRLGLTGKLQYSLTTAAGLFKNIVGLIFIVTSNAVIRRIGEGENGIW